MIYIWLQVADHHEWEDVRSVVAMTDGKYCTAEPFVTGDFDLRIQKLGNHYRVFKQCRMHSLWRGQVAQLSGKQLPCRLH